MLCALLCAQLCAWHVLCVLVCFLLITLFAPVFFSWPLYTVPCLDLPSSARPLVFGCGGVTVCLSFAFFPCDRRRAMLCRMVWMCTFIQSCVCCLAAASLRGVTPIRGLACFLVPGLADVFCCACVGWWVVAACVWCVCPQPHQVARRLDMDDLRWAEEQWKVVLPDLTSDLQSLCPALMPILPLPSATAHTISLPNAALPLCLSASCSCNFRLSDFCGPRQRGWRC